METLSKPQPVDVNEDNFSELFKDVRRGQKPETGEVLASWRAGADFVDGWIKRNVLEILSTNEVGAESAVKVLKNVVGAIDRDAIGVCKEMTEDLLTNMTLDEIIAKPYHFTIEMFYWVKPEYVPKTVNWTTYSVFDTTNPTNRDLIESKILV